MAKALAVLLVVWRQKWDRVVNGLIYSTVAAVGFAWNENISYYVQGSQNFRLGGLLDHALFSSFWGIALGYAKTHSGWRPKFAVGIALLLSAVTHGTSNFFRLDPDWKEEYHLLNLLNPWREETFVGRSNVFSFWFGCALLTCALTLTVVLGRPWFGPRAHPRESAIGWGCVELGMSLSFFAGLLSWQFAFFLGLVGYVLSALLAVGGLMRLVRGVSTREAT